MQQEKTSQEDTMKLHESLSSITFLACLLTFQLTVQAKESSAKQIMEKVSQYRKIKATESVSTLTIINARGQKRIRQIAAVSKLFDKGNTEKRLIRFLAPADVKGTGLLTFDYESKEDDMWLYMPALRKTRRIVSSEKSKNFMGSEFTYADMNIPKLDDFSYSFLEEETIDGTKCWTIETTPKNQEIADDYGFSKRVVSIGQQDYVLRKALYYNFDGELHKVMHAKNIELIDPANKRYRPMHMKMVNKQNNRKSIMQVESIELAKNVKDDYFSTRYLQRP